MQPRDDLPSHLATLSKIKSSRLKGFFPLEVFHCEFHHNFSLCVSIPIKLLHEIVDIVNQSSHKKWNTGIQNDELRYDYDAMTKSFYPIYDEHKYGDVWRDTKLKSDPTYEPEEYSDSDEDCSDLEDECMCLDS